MSASPGNLVQQTQQYFGEVQSEFKKVTWPSQQETVAGTMSTIVILGVIAAVLGVVDWVLSWAISAILP